MKRRFLILLLLPVFALALHHDSLAQKLYRKTFGDPAHPAIVFLHGGPGYNSAAFEIGAAENLAARGYYVVVYDRRGTVRSKVKKEPAYTFAEASQDLKSILAQSKIKRATLIGHSFGGAVAVRFAQAYPEQVERVVLVGAPLDFPGTFRAILGNCRKYYEAANDEGSLAYISMLDTMDNRPLGYSSYCFAHAMICGLYQPKEQTEEALALSKAMEASPEYTYMSKTRPGPVEGFHRNHLYTTLNLHADVRALKSKIPFYGIFGQEDGLFNTQVLDEIGETIGRQNLHMVEGAGHNVFLDQQTSFFQVLDAIMQQ